MITTTFRMDDKLYKKAKLVSLQTDMKLNDIYNQAVEQFCDKILAKHIRKGELNDRNKTQTRILSL